jgi:hypothetical protein
MEYWSIGISDVKHISHDPIGMVGIMCNLIYFITIIIQAIVFFLLSSTYIDVTLVTW